VAEVFQFPGEEFLELLERRPDLSRRMISALAQRIGELADRIENDYTLNALGRVARWLSDQPSNIMSDGARCVTLPMTKKRLAENLGMKPETLSRALRMLLDERVIAKSKQGFIVLQPTKLIELSNAT